MLWSQEDRTAVLPLNKAQRKAHGEAGRLLTESATPAATIPFQMPKAAALRASRAPAFRAQVKSPRGLQATTHACRHKRFPEDRAGEAGSSHICCWQGLGCLLVALAGGSPWSKTPEEGPTEPGAVVLGAQPATQNKPVPMGC